MKVVKGDVEGPISRSSPGVAEARWLLKTEAGVVGGGSLLAEDDDGV